MTTTTKFNRSDNGFIISWTIPSHENYNELGNATIKIEDFIPFSIAGDNNCKGRTDESSSTRYSIYDGTGSYWVTGTLKAAKAKLLGILNLD